jgi:uncharacterized protein with HEPN domain
MAPTTPQQAVADILHRIEKARRHIVDTSFEEFCEDETKQGAVLYDLLCASEAQYRLYHHWKHVSDAFEARHPEISWKEFRNVSNRYRHGYDDVDVRIVWEDLGPKGIITQVEAILHEEIPFAGHTPHLPLADRLTTPQQLDVLHRSDIFSQSMRRSVRTEETPQQSYEGKIVWLREVPGVGIRLALIDAGDHGPYRRIVIEQTHDLNVGNEVAVQPHADGFTISCKETPPRLHPNLG